MENNSVDLQHNIDMLNAKQFNSLTSSINQHLESTPLPDVNKLETTIEQVWRRAKPVVVFLAKALLMSPAWSEAIDNLVQFLDNASAKKDSM